MKLTVLDKQTGEAAEPGRIVRNEAWAGGLLWYRTLSFVLDEDGWLWLVDDCGGATGCPEGRFEVVFHPEPGDRLEPLTDCQSLDESVTGGVQT